MSDSVSPDPIPTLLHYNCPLGIGQRPGADPASVQLLIPAYVPNARRHGLETPPTLDRSGALAGPAAGRAGAAGPSAACGREPLFTAGGGPGSFHISGDP